MVIVAGHLQITASERDAYLEGCRQVVEQARRAPGCLDFALSPDLVEPGRINILERWEDQAAVEAFRGEGVGDEQGVAILDAVVAEYDVGLVRPLA